MALPPAQLDRPTIEREIEQVDAQSDEITLDLACRGWAASVQGALPNPAASLSWQGLVAHALLGAQRREEALALAQSAYDASLALGGSGRPAARRAAIAMTMAHLQVRDPVNTLLWAQRSVDAGDPALPLDQEGALALANRASADLMTGQFQEGERRLVALLAQIREQPQMQPLAYGRAVALNQLLYAQAAQARMADALATAEQLVAHRRQYLAKDRTGLAVAIGNQGSILVNLGRFDEAQALLEAAVEEARNGGSTDAAASGALELTRSNLGNLLLARGKPGQALALAQEAAAQTQGGTRLNALHQLANAQLALGELSAAVRTLREALAIVQAEPPMGEAWLRLRVLLGYAQAMLSLGDSAEARRLLDLAEAEVARAPANLAERGQRLVVLASLLQQQRQPAEALQALDQADAFYATQLAPDSPQRLDLAIRACGLERGCDALPSRMAAPDLLPRLSAAGALVLARQRLAAGNALAAQEQASRAIEASLASAQPLLQWQAMAEYARALAALERRAEAIFFGKMAIDRLQFTRSRLAGLGADADALYLADKLQVYRQLAAWLFDAERLPEGLEVLRLLKRSEQDDFNERSGVAWAGSLSLNAREQAWRLKMEAATSPGLEQAAEIQRLSRLQAARRITPDEAERLKALRDEQLAQRPATRERLAGMLAALQADARALPLTATSRRPALRMSTPSDSHTVHAYLLAEPQQLRAVLVSQRGKRVLRAAVAPAALSAQIAALLDAVHQRQDVHGAAQALYAHIGPLLDAPARAWGAQRLVLWLDGPLRYLPFGLLHDGRSYLAERYAISLATAADAAATPAPKSAPVPALRIHAWGVTQALAGLPALPGVGDELCGVVNGPLRGLDRANCLGALPGQGDANGYFTEAAWRAAGQVDTAGGVVHVGTHFVLRPGNVTQSWLLLGDGSRLMLERLRRWPLGAPRLITLSACETAVPTGPGADGREVDGLVATLLGSGAHQVVASLWRVDDRATGQLMRRFYAEAARRPHDIPAALQAAQRAALRAGAPAHVWAAFTVSSAAASR